MKIADIDPNIDEILNSDLANKTPDEVTALINALDFSIPEHCRIAANLTARLLVAAIAKIKQIEGG